MLFLHAAPPSVYKSSRPLIVGGRGSQPLNRCPPSPPHHFHQPCLFIGFWAASSWTTLLVTICVHHTQVLIVCYPTIVNWYITSSIYPQTPHHYIAAMWLYDHQIIFILFVIHGPHSKMTLAKSQVIVPRPNVKCRWHGRLKVVLQPHKFQGSVVGD